MSTLKATTRPCLNCATEMERTETCPTCGWYPGTLPVAQHNYSNGETGTTFVREPRHRLIALFGVLAVFLGLVALGGIGSGDPAGVLAALIFGPSIIFAGIVTIKTTKFGKIWKGLESQDKAKAMPGLLLGVFAGICALPALIIGAIIFRFALSD